MSKVRTRGKTPDTPALEQNPVETDRVGTEPGSAPAPLHRVVPSRATAILVVMILLTILGAWLRLRHADVRQFWGDEIHTFQVANEPRSVAELWRTWWTTRIMADPPLFYFASYLNVSGASSYSHLRLRLLPILFGVASIVMTFVVFRRLRGTPTALVGACLMAVSTYAIQYSQEYRPYSMLLFASLLFLDALVIICRRYSRKAFIYLFLSSAFLIYTHYFGGFVLAAGYLIWLPVAWRSSRKTGARFPFAAAGILPVGLAILYIPMFLHAPGLARDYSPVFSPEGSIAKRAFQEYLANKKNLTYLLNLFHSFMGWRLGTTHPVAIAYLVILMIAGALRVLLGNAKLFFCMAVWLALNLIMSFGFYEALQFPYEPRRNIFDLPIYLLLVSEAMTWPLVLARAEHDRRRKQILGFSATAVLLLPVLWISGDNYLRYDNHGWRFENNQADWRGMARYVGSNARDDDQVIVQAEPGKDTWVNLHYTFYHQQEASRIPLLRIANAEEFFALRSEGKSAWLIFAQAWNLPEPVFNYVMSYGQILPFIGGGLVYLPPTSQLVSLPGPEQSIAVQHDMTAALVPRRRLFIGDVTLSGTVTAKLAFDTKTTLALLQVPEGVLNLSLTPTGTDPELTTMSLARRIEPGKWVSALELSGIAPSSRQINVRVRDGMPYLYMMHNGSVFYEFYLDEGGTFDLHIDACHDRPGPVKARVFVAGSRELPRFVWGRKNNRFSPVSQRVTLSAGAHQLKVYYDSFIRLRDADVTGEDAHSSFEMARWKLERVR